MIKLHVNETTITTGTAIISWCIGKDTLEHLSQQRAVEPHLLIITMPQVKKQGDYVNHQHEERRLLPLGNLLTYMPLKHVGRLRIFARLVWIDEYEKRPVERLFDRYLNENDRGRNSKYGNQLLTSDGAEFIDNSSYEEEEQLRDPYITLSKRERRRLEGQLKEKKAAQAHIQNLISTSIDIDVPEGCFAKEPPAWMQKWVNLHFGWAGQPYDECEFRKRAIYAVLLQPFVVAVNYVCRVAATIGMLSVGMRDINFRPLRDVLDTSISDIWFGADRSIFYPNWNDEKHLWGLSNKFLPLYFIPYAFSPLALLVIGAGWYLYTRNMQLAFTRTGMTLAGWTLGITIVLLCIFGVVGIWMKIVEAWRDREREADNRKYEERRQREREERRIREEELAKPFYLRDSELAVLTCDQAFPRTKLADLPKERQTIYLRFLDLKVKVCRPFAVR